MSAHPASAPRFVQPDSPTDKQICFYIAEMCVELRRLAMRPAGLRTLRYLLDMARLEAERASKGPGA